MSGNIKRVLVYTHNSIGLGHAFRTLAVITGMRKWRPDIDFLILSSTSIPQIFFDEGIEVIKLPSVKIDIDGSDNRMLPRYLSDFDLETIFDFRQRIILETFDFFKPDAFIIEHNMTGQMSELIPVLMKKWMRKGGPADFAVAHVSRGIMRWVPLLKIPYQNPRHRSESINIGELYDFMYVLEDQQVIDINKAFLGDDPALEKKIRYLGKITNKTHGEIASRDEVISRFGLTNHPIILVSLGRNRLVQAISEKLLSTFRDINVIPNNEVVMILDPYLDKRAAEALRNHPSAEDVHFLTFVPDLVDLVRHAELVISRAGYNMVNEILLTGTRAILVPESHGGGEQEQRVRSVNQENIRVLNENQIFHNGTDQLILDLLNSSSPRIPRKFDKYAIGKSIIEDLEQWTAQNKA